MQTLNPVTLQLCDSDFTSNAVTINNYLIHLLSMKFAQNSQKSFSRKFTLIETLGSPLQIGSDNFHFARPNDVKLCYSTRCILVSDTHNQRIQSFDLDTKIFKGTIHTPHWPQFLCVIESNLKYITTTTSFGKYANRKRENSEHDASVLVSCSDHCVYKYSIRKCIDSFQQSNTMTKFLKSFVGTLIPQLKLTEYIWKSGISGEDGNSLHHFSQPSSMALVEKQLFSHTNASLFDKPLILPSWESQPSNSITNDSSRSSEEDCKHSNESNWLVLVCDSLNHRIKVLNPTTGQALVAITHYHEMIQRMSGPQLKLVRFFTPKFIVVSPHTQDILFVENLKSSSRIVLLRQGDFSKNGIAHCVHVQEKSVTIKGLLGDLNVSGLMYIADRNGISIRNVLGHLTDESPFNGNCEVYSPSGMCLNEHNGELHVVDYVYHTLQVFQ
ncbi:hypothetical protein C9374_010948 [Naegleria lovaniensis]|uniref:Uncharacterized protein n=1 Tax=Naegleria lovaniensis TaxID=51637 RepID=A0AA88GFS0_NAELO|nr:uncharacterized protein C9374_010948 [Naegleria lovaniensis]KAG2374378.1 hypothetical protein C9374_010948 [Naegleria lovaniensis]